MPGGTFCCSAGGPSSFFELRGSLLEDQLFLRTVGFSLHLLLSAYIIKNEAGLPFWFGGYQVNSFDFTPLILSYYPGYWLQLIRLHETAGYLDLGAVQQRQRFGERGMSQCGAARIAPSIRSLFHMLGDLDWGFGLVCGRWAKDNRTSLK